MTGASAGPRTSVLYTPDLLALAVSLAEVPYDPAMPHIGDARSRTCGSTVIVSLSTDESGRVADVGLRVSACAVGQAAAALFAAGARGFDRSAIAAARDEIAAWLAGSAGVPDWPEIDLLDAARPFPARHGAVLLAWDGALAALSNERAGG